MATIQRFTPYRVAAFFPPCKGMKNGYAVIRWNPCEQTADAAGRPGFGSFDWRGLRDAKAEAGRMLAQGAHQVQIRGNQDRPVLIYRRGGGTCGGAIVY